MGKDIVRTAAKVAERGRNVRATSRHRRGNRLLYVSDFGEHVIRVDRFMRPSVMFGLDPDYIGVAFLQPIQQKPLAVNGHADKRMVWCQATLVLQNPFAHLKISDINPAK